MGKGNYTNAKLAAKPSVRPAGLPLTWKDVICPLKFAAINATLTIVVNTLRMKVTYEANRKFGTVETSENNERHLVVSLFIYQTHKRLQSRLENLFYSMVSYTWLRLIFAIVYLQD